MKLIAAKVKIKKYFANITRFQNQDRFLEDMTKNYDYFLGVKTRGGNFFSFDVKDCEAENYLSGSHNDFCSELVEIMENALYDLLLQGKSYVYIEQNYLSEDKSEINSLNEQNDLQSLRVRMLDCIERGKNHSIINYSRNYDGKIKKEILKSGTLIVFDLREIGYSRSYFRRLLKRLKKYDEFEFSADMIRENNTDYEFLVHQNRNRIAAMKATKAFGWNKYAEGMSESYILYTLIKKYEFMGRMLQYFVGKINKGIRLSLPTVSPGHIIYRLKIEDYDELWIKYSSGQINLDKLRKIIFD